MSVDYFNFDFLNPNIIMPITLAATFLMAFAFCKYIFNSVGLFTIAKNRGKNNGILAWIPFVNICYAGYIADDINKKSGKKSINKVMLIITTAINAAFVAFLLILLSSIGASAGMSSYDFATNPDAAMQYIPAFAGIMLLSFFVSIVSVVQFVFFNISMYVIYKNCCNKYRVVFTVLTVIFKLNWIFVFISRHGGDHFVSEFEENTAPACSCDQCGDCEHHDEQQTELPKANESDDEHKQD